MLCMHVSTSWVYLIYLATIQRSLISGTAQAQHGSSPMFKHRVPYAESHSPGSISGTAQARHGSSPALKVLSPIRRVPYAGIYLIIISHHHNIMSHNNLITSPALTYLLV